MLKRFTHKKTMVFLASFVACVFFVTRQAWAFPVSFFSISCPKWNETSFSCGLCSVMMIFFDASNYLTLKAAQALSEPMTKVLALGLAFWILFQTINYFSKPFSELNAADFLTKVGTMLFRAVIGLIFIQNGCAFVFEYIIGPFFYLVSGLIGLISTVNGSSSVHPTTNLISIAEAAITGHSTLDLSLIPGQEAYGALSEDVRNAVGGMVGGFASGLTEIRKVGFLLLCKGFTGISIPDPLLEIDLFIIKFSIGFSIPNPFMIIWGLLLYIMYSVVGFAYALMFLDVVFRLALIMVFFPIAAAAWVFPATQKYTKAIWTVLLHTAFVFVSSALFLSLVSSLAKQSLSFFGNDVWGHGFMDYMYRSNYGAAWRSLTGGIPIISDVASGFYFPFFATLAIALIALFGAKIPDEYAAHMTSSGFNAIENCAVKTLKFIINTIIAIILLALTIVSYGAAAECPVLQGVEQSEEAIQKIKKLKETIEKIKKWKKRLQKIKDQVASKK